MKLWGLLAVSGHLRRCRGCRRSCGVIRLVWASTCVCMLTLERWGKKLYLSLYEGWGVRVVGEEVRAIEDMVGYL